MTATKTGLFVFGLMILLSSAAIAGVNPKLQLASYSLSENPAVPGHSPVLLLHIQNIDADNCADRVAVQVSANYPLSVQGSDTQYLSELCNRDGNADFSFAIPIDSLATTGNYPLSISTTYELRYAKFSENNTITVHIAGQPLLNAAVVSSNPTDIYPGDTASVQLQFQNTGQGRADNAHLEVTALQGIEVKWAGQTQNLGSIAANAGTTATVTVQSDKTLSPGTYPLTAVLQYASEDGTPKSQTFTFDLPIKARADYTADTTASGPVFIGEQKLVSIVLKNTGQEEATNLKIRIRPYFPFSTDGTVRFVDRLGPGQTVSLDYQITVDKDATVGKQLLSFLIDFEDAQGKTFSDTADFSLSVENKSVLQALADNWLLVLIVLAIAGFVYQRQKKKKTAKK